MKRLVIDRKIPYLQGRIERFFVCDYADAAAITRERLAGASGLLVRTRTQCKAPLLEDTGVEFVATGTIGLDHFDIPWLESAGIDWQNAPGCNAPGVAQYVWSVLGRMGFDPTKRGANTLGVVGKGNVGRIIVEWGRKLGAEVLVCDPPRQRRGESDEDYMSIGELASRCDAITFHTPLTRVGTDATWHLADENVISRLREGAFVVNAARGGVVDEEALRRHAKERGLHVAIDTWEGEPGINVATLALTEIATPHIAGYSAQGKQRATLAILRGLERHYGITLPTDGLAEPYSAPVPLTMERILDSFDPAPLDKALRQRPAEFEKQREEYQFRDEVGYEK